MNHAIIRKQVALLSSLVLLAFWLTACTPGDSRNTEIPESTPAAQSTVPSESIGEETSADNTDPIPSDRPLDIPESTFPEGTGQVPPATSEEAPEPSTEGGHAVPPDEIPEASTEWIPPVQSETTPTEPPVIVEIPETTAPRTDFERYNNMSPEQQQAFYESFENAQDFFDWLKAAKKEYADAHPDIVIGNGEIHLEP